MTTQQQQWASQHDWFLRAFDGGVYAYEAETNDTIFFTSIAKLKTWAGY